jgi:glycosyltransferase involved in cell wall biosynthesis
MDLSVIIPSRNEEFLGRTINDILDKARAETEVIVILDGYWPDPPIPDRKNVVFIHHTESIGQRAAVNEGACLSKAKFIMKLDAHTVVDEGFDVKLMADCEYDWTVIPRMYNLYGFDWVCKKCGNRWYQGPEPTKCKKNVGREKLEDNEKCDSVEFEREIIWKPRWNRRTDFARFDSTMHFQYWRQYDDRPESKTDIADVMSTIGNGLFMHRGKILRFRRNG